jgi:hypothetical protein
LHRLPWVDLAGLRDLLGKLISWPIAFLLPFRVRLKKRPAL